MQFEYHVRTFHNAYSDSVIQRALNDLSSAGWRLMRIVALPKHSVGLGVQLYFERPVAGTKGENDHEPT